jgi:sortase (surface protein transpeptidase)
VGSHSRSVTPAPRQPGGRGRRRKAALPAAVLVIAGLLLGAAAIIFARNDDNWRAAPRSSTFDAAVPGGRMSLLPSPVRPKGRKRPAPRPVHIRIPAIGVSARVIRLGLNPDHTLEVPRNFSDTGWWAGGTSPGDPGPAVIAGHVDSYTGPAVYFRLKELRRGDQIRIERRNGSAVRFTVQGLHSYPKSRFPTKRVYGPTRQPTLRLITCSGTFDRSTGHYLDNTVVFATLAARS